MTHPRILRATILGAAGRQGRRRTDAVLQTPGLALAKLVDVPEFKDDLQCLARQSKCAFTTDWQKAVTSRATDVVIICTPNHLHAEMAIEALGHGKHVLLEKPLANTLEDATKIVAERRSVSSVLKVGFNYRYRDPIKRALEYLRSGVIGRLLSLRAVIGHSQFLEPLRERSWFVDPTLGGRGALLDLGVHMLDLARLALSIDHDEFESVVARTCVGRVFNPTADTTPADRSQVDEEACAIFRSRAGRNFILNASWVELRKFLGARIEFIGDDGRIEADLTTHTTRLVRRGHGMLREELTAFDAVSPDPSWAAELVELRDSILYGRPLEGNGEDGLAAQRLVFAAYASAQAGGYPVQLEDFDCESKFVGPNQPNISTVHDVDCGKITQSREAVL